METKADDIFADKIIGDATLKPCPFCGGAGVMLHKVVARGSSSKKPKDGDKIVYNTDVEATGEVSYFWMRKAYSVRCNTSNCFCRMTDVVFKTKEDAERAWNNRPI